MTKEATSTEEVIIDADALAQISKSVGEALAPQLEEKLKEATDKSAEALQAVIDKFVEEHDIQLLKVSVTVLFEKKLLR